MKKNNEYYGFEEKRGNANLSNIVGLSGVCFEGSTGENAYSHLDITLNQYFSCGVHGFEGYRF